MVDQCAVTADTVLLALKTVKTLRSSVAQVFNLVTDGIKDNQEKDYRERKFIVDVQQQLLNIGVHFKDLENICGSVNPQLSVVSLGHYGQLIEDPVQNKSPIYLQLTQAHKWTDKVVHEFSSHAVSYLNQNSLKRSSINPGIMNKRLRKSLPTSHSVSTQIVDTVAANCNRLFADMSVTLSRPHGNSAILQITIGQTLKALIVLRSLVVEWVVVKGFNEDFYVNDGKELGLWSSSQYIVFQKVTEHANAAMLHFYSPLIPDLAVRSFMTWLHSYFNLFTAPCRRCGKHLNDNLPPTWRDVRNLDPYHESCRP
uniref:Mediator of RNA polymerase II transcription subunit 27 n=1 Tax=Strigamia maritima TaxID=126957 RepID=T1J9H8_STRMM